jgi:hypothetical protein
MYVSNTHSRTNKDHEEEKEVEDREEEKIYL